MIFYFPALYTKIHPSNSIEVKKLLFFLFMLHGELETGFCGGRRGWPLMGRMNKFLEKERV